MAAASGGTENHDRAQRPECDVAAQTFDRNRHCAGDAGGDFPSAAAQCGTLDDGGAVCGFGRNYRSRFFHVATVACLRTGFCDAGYFCLQGLK